MQNTIAKRLKAAREQSGLTQQQLSDQLGFKDRQTLAAIETGARKISADELLAAMKALNRDLEYFTDPFRLEGEGTFTWRSSADAADRLAEFESQAGAWIALYRHLGMRERTWTAPVRLDLTAKSTYEDAHRAAAWLGDEWALGEIPAQTLEGAIRERLRALVLYVDAPEGVSGAAFRLPELSAILINRNEPVGRRNFDLAHELFHLLTWPTIRPAHSEDSGILQPKGRPEQLANCFASALLMPENVIRRWWAQPAVADQSARTRWLLESARQFRVSAAALQWRLVPLGMLKKSDVDESRDLSPDLEAKGDRPRLFGLDFVTALRGGIEDGRISVRRASTLMGLTIDELADLFGEYGLGVPFDI